MPNTIESQYPSWCCARDGHLSHNWSKFAGPARRLRSRGQLLLIPHNCFYCSLSHYNHKLYKFDSTSLFQVMCQRSRRLYSHLILNNTLSKAIERKQLKFYTLWHKNLVLDCAPSPQGYSKGSEFTKNCYCRAAGHFFFRNYRFY